MIKRTFVTHELYKYYQNYASYHTHFVLMDKEAFSKKLIQNKLVFVSYDGEINGFISASVDHKKAYINLVFGEKDIQKTLIIRLEKTLITMDIKEIWIHFFNPTKLAWYPLRDVVHPGIQGVVRDSDLHHLYQDLGYQENSIQETYYQSLDDFDIRDVEIDQIDKVDFYDEKKHLGLFDFAKNIGVKDWKNTIIFNQKSKDPLPLLVALDQNRVVGFTGPIIKETSQRGYFAGIAILEDYRGKGLGKALFFKLCQVLKNSGSKYMTFFTGTNNPAKYIYQRAGFKVVETFVTMKKSLRKDV